MLASIWPEATRSLNPKSPKNPKTLNPKSPTIEPTPLFLTVPGGFTKPCEGRRGPPRRRRRPEKNSAPQVLGLIFAWFIYRGFWLEVLVVFCSFLFFFLCVCFVWGFWLSSYPPVGWVFQLGLQLDLRLSHRPFVGGKRCVQGRPITCPHDDSIHAVKASNVARPCYPCLHDDSAHAARASNVPKP